MICVTDFRKRRGGAFCLPHLWAAPKRSNLNRVKLRSSFYFIHLLLIFVCNEEHYLIHHHTFTHLVPPSIHQTYTTVYASSLSVFQSYDCIFLLLVSCCVCYLCICISLYKKKFSQLFFRSLSFFTLVLNFLWFLHNFFPIIYYLR